MSALETLPDEQIRQSVRDFCQFSLQVLGCEGDVVKQMNYKKKFIHKLRSSPIAIETQAANEQHYEVPTEFFLPVLGPKLKYSCCYWPEGCDSLEQAEVLAFDIMFERAKLVDGLTVLDLGCGWGATALEVLARYPKSNVVAVSNSQTQREFIVKTAQQRGFSQRLQVITADANFFSPPAELKFDRIISIEMFEHMKNYEELLQRVSSWLKPDGLLFVQILCHLKYTYPFNSTKGSDAEWMAKNFFSGGTMPSTDLLLYFQQHVSIEDQWLLNGSHYAKTLEAWLVRMDKHPELKAVFKKDFLKKKQAGQTEAQINEEVESYWRKWRTFFIYCAEVFAYDQGREWLVAQYLFSKNDTTKPKLRSRL